MNSIIETLPQLLGYQPAFFSLALLCLITVLQSILIAPLAFIKEDEIPGMPLKGDHSQLGFRVARTYLNSTESVPTFAFTLLIAILFGVNASLVNWVTVVYLLSRIAFWFVYYQGIGKVAGGPRTLCYVLGILCNLVLICATLYAIAS